MQPYLIGGCCCYTNVMPREFNCTHDMMIHHIENPGMGQFFAVVNSATPESSSSQTVLSLIDLFPQPQVGDEGEVVGGEGGAGQPGVADLVARGHLEHGLDAHPVLGVEDVVERLLVLAVLADLPRRVRVGGVGRVQTENERGTKFFRQKVG